MRRIDSDGDVDNLFGTGNHGFADGVPGVSAATAVNADWFNSTQEEIARVIESSTPLDPTDNGQLVAAIFGAIDAFAATQMVATALVPGAFYNDCASDNANTIVLVAGGVTDPIYTSLDGGATFASHAMGSGATANLYAVCRGATKFVAVGASGEIQTSQLGTLWTHQSSYAGYSGGFRDVCYAPALGLYCAVGENGEVETSPAGVTWTKRTHPAGGSDIVQSVAWNERLGLFCTVHNSVATTSPDGITWTAQTTPTEFGGWNNVYATPYGFLLLKGDNSTSNYCTSVDGVTWAVHSDITFAHSGADGWNECCSRTGMVATSDTAGLYIARAPNAPPRLVMPGTFAKLYRTAIAWVSSDGTNMFVAKLPF